LAANSSNLLSFPLGSRRVEANFNGGYISSEGGLVLLSQLDRRLGLIHRLAMCLTDNRQASKVAQSIEDMLRQRIFGICLGYEDCNDFDTLCADPMFKLASGRLPETGRNLASQPTLSRFENNVGRRELLKMSSALMDQFVGSHTGARRIVIDIDATDDPAHGQQEFEFFHGYYGCHCFLPLLVFATVDDAPEQHLIAAVLRPGNKHAGHGTVAVLSRIVQRLRDAWPDAQIILRGDAGFSLPAVQEFCEQKGVEYTLSLAKNSRLLSMAEPLLEQARQECIATQQKVKRFGEISYAAKSWPHERRVIVKAEIMPAHGDNPRFVVTNSTEQAPEALYNFYTDRGDVENRIKELKNDLASGRTSCHRFVANQFRLLMHATAMILMQALRRLLDGTEMAAQQAGTLRLKLLKVGVQVRQTCRRIWLRLPTSYPWQSEWRRIVQHLNVGTG
jgi:hypothetical protein